MADFIDSEAEESEDEEELDEVDRKKLKRVKAIGSDDDEEDDDVDDEDRLREELKDLIDDNPIEEDEEQSGSEEDDAGKRKRDEDDELDDRLDEEDYELLEDNLGVKLQRKRQFKRLRRIQDEESDEGSDKEDREGERDAIANELFEGSDKDEESVREHRTGAHDASNEYDSEEDGNESDIGDFIVDNEGRPIAEKRKKRKPIFRDAALQEAQDIFGVDFDYDEMVQYDEEYEEEEEEEVEEDGEGGERRVRTKKTKKKTTRKSIYELYEPSELERGHLTDFDAQIRSTDIPERMQLRHVPVTPVPEGSDELDMEAEWIYKFAFVKGTISRQEASRESETRDRNRRGPGTVAKIRKALDFMRNQQLEVPFLAFYRKEYVQPELNLADLWRVYAWDGKWCQLQARKRNLVNLMERMRQYQLEQLTMNPDQPLPDNVRVLKDEDIDLIHGVQTMEELRDVHGYFWLHYGSQIPAMQEAHRAKQRQEALERRERKRRERERRLEEREDRGEGEDDKMEDLDKDGNDDEEEEPIPEEETTVKQAKRSDMYTLCQRAGLGTIVKRFGLTPEQFAENLRDSYQRHEVEQFPIEPLEVAQEMIGPKFSTAEEVLKAAQFMLATEISRHPLVRQCVREAFFERARIHVVPTKRGEKEIDENHALYGMKYLKGKPVRDLVGDQFLKLATGQEDKLITLTLDTKLEGTTGPSPSYVEEAQQLFHRDEFSKAVQEWNAVRGEVVRIALENMLLPQLAKELKTTLTTEAREVVSKACSHKLYSWLKVAPYSVNFPDEVEDEWDTRDGLRIAAIAYVPDLEQAAFGVCISPYGEVLDHIRLQHILKRKNAWKEQDRNAKESDLRILRKFFLARKPHVVVVGGESREAMSVVEDIRGVLAQLAEDEQFPPIAVELLDNSLAKVYASSTRAETDFRDFPPLLREAISLARRTQDPLLEFSQLCGTEEEILCLRYHPMQDQLSKEELLEALYLEFVNRANDVGVDVNRALTYNHTSNVLQFICGLGSRKAQALLKILKQTNQRLENRTQLVTLCHMGPKVFINCAGFIKIDTASLGDSTEAYVEVLDGTRVHPETYEWARKMAVDALEYDDEEANPAGALEEILESPERLKDLDLDAFADELERQGFGNKSITLYDIRAELNHRYKDLRTPYQSPAPEEVFNMLTKETPETFYLGKMVMCTVSGFSHRKPQREQLDRANPVRQEDTGLWQCPFCLQADFPDLSEVWNHFDAGACSGQATGVRVQLDNGLSGFVPIKMLSDSEVRHPEQRVKPGMTVHCRLIKIDVEKFQVTCTCRSSDLRDSKGEWRPPKDPYYDASSEERAMKSAEDAIQQKQRTSYTKRVIVHPSFHNISFQEVEKLMAKMDQGEVIVRPSSKGSDHLTVTWKVTEGILQHIDVREEGKENAFSLGRSLWVGEEEFEDLDEIIARHVNPMAAHARDLINFRYYKDIGLHSKDKEASTPNATPSTNPPKSVEREKAEEWLREERKKNASKIHYIMTASREFPGKFMLSYMPRKNARHEFVTVTPEGFRFRGQIFETLAVLFKWFKEHFRDPIPGTPTSNKSAAPAGARTPYMGGMTPHMGTAGGAPVAGMATPHFAQSTPGFTGYSATTPYTPSGQTPFMTPYTTPRYPSTPGQAPPATPPQQYGTYGMPGATSNPALQHRQGQAAGQVFRQPATPARGGQYPFQRPAVPPQSPGMASPSSRSRPPSQSSAVGHGGGQESSDWRDAAAAWASSTTSASPKPRPQSQPAAQGHGGGKESSDWRNAAAAWAQSTTSPSPKPRPPSQASSQGHAAGKESDDWRNAAAAWAQGSSPSPRSRPPSQPAPPAPAGGRESDDWRNAAAAWAQGGSPAPRSRPPSQPAPQAQSGGKDADDWRNAAAAWSQSTSATPRSRPPSQAAPQASAGGKESDDWRNAAAAWAQGSGPSPRSRPPSQNAAQGHSGGGGGKESSDWRDAAAAWAATSSSPSPRQRPPSQPAAQGDGEGDWRDAAAAWAQGSSRRGSTSGAGNTTPRSSGRPDERRTPRYDGRGTPQGGRASATPKSTPRTINSPRNMDIGDGTPLYDE